MGSREMRALSTIAAPPGRPSQLAYSQTRVGDTLL